MMARNSALAVVLPVLAGCAAHSAAITPSRWVGCYHLEWGTDSAQLSDSVRLTIGVPQRDERAAGFRVLYLAPGDSIVPSTASWYLRGDSIILGQGVFTGWSVHAHLVAKGFAGRYEVFKDCCGPPYSTYYPVVGTRTRCPDAPAT